MHSLESKNRKSFTLIELLVVLALVAILSVVVILTLNPAELIKQARDSNRLSDLATINTALNLFSADVTAGFMGTSTVVYISIPDTSPVCANLNLPALPTSTVAWTYGCVTASTLKNTNGTGWIPVNFQRISSNSPISQLPVDPINTTSTRLYYTYVSGGSWGLSANIEAAKNKLGGSNDLTSKDGGSIVSLYEVGNNLTLNPVEYGDSSLVGWWRFNEGSGTTPRDSSGNGRSGSFLSVPIWTANTGCVQGSCLEFDNVDDGVDIPSFTFAGATDYTMTAWVKIKGAHKNYTGTIMSSGDWNNNFWALGIGQNNTYVDARKMDATVYYSYNYAFSLNTWYFVSITRRGTLMSTYVNNILVGSAAISAAALISNATDMTIGRETYAGGYFAFNGFIDEPRIYNRALSAAEVSALYNATK